MGEGKKTRGLDIGFLQCGCQAQGRFLQRLKR